MSEQYRIVIFVLILLVLYVLLKHLFLLVFAYRLVDTDRNCMGIAYYFRTLRVGSCIEIDNETYMVVSVSYRDIFSTRLTIKKI